MFETRKLSKVTSYIARGISPFYDEVGITILNQRCIRDNRVSKSEARLTNPEKKSINTQKLLQVWDVLVNSTGVGTLGRVGQYKKHLEPCTVDSHITIVRPNLSIVNGSYFGYAMIFREPIVASMGEGATGQTELSRVRLGSEIDIPLPPLPTQHKIAAILSAYDDLIENNMRRITILEEMVQSLYHEWFVYLRFPGHEKNAMVESQLGMIPERWEVKSFAELAKLLRDTINPGKFPNETFAHYSIPALDCGYMPTMDRGESIKSNKFLVSKDSLLLSKINPRIARVWLPSITNSERAIASTEFLVITAKQPYSREYLYSICRSVEFLDKFASLAGGTSTSHQRVNIEGLNNLLVVCPEQALAQKFTEFIVPTLVIIHNLRLKNANLHRTRNLLLPKLISGELDVEGLDIEMAGDEADVKEEETVDIGTHTIIGRGMSIDDE